jgi:hypothetical protein
MFQLSGGLEELLLVVAQKSSRAMLLLRSRRQSPYPMDSDYVLPSPTKKGKQPY